MQNEEEKLLKEIIAKMNNLESIIKHNSKPLSLQEACKYLDVTQSQLYRLTHLNQIPHYKPGGKKIYFNVNELNEWVYSKLSENEKDEINSLHII